MSKQSGHHYSEKEMIALIKKEKKKVDLALDHEQIKAKQEKENSKKQLLRPQKSGR